METKPKIDIRFSLSCVLTKKIRAAGLTEYKSPEARRTLIRLAKESLTEVHVPESEREAWMDFCARAMDTTNMRFNV